MSGSFPRGRPLVPSREHRRWTASRALALALALSAALGPTAAALHLALAPHAICPEHGEVIEGSTSGDAHAGAATTRHGWSEPAPEQGDQALEDHLHCGAVAPMRAPALSAPRAALAAAPSRPADVVKCEAAGAPIAAPCVLTCAPKQSPPSPA